MQSARPPQPAAMSTNTSAIKTSLRASPARAFSNQREKMGHGEDTHTAKAGYIQRSLTSPGKVGVRKKDQNASVSRRAARSDARLARVRGPAALQVPEQHAAHERYETEPLLQENLLHQIGETCERHAIWTTARLFSRVYRRRPAVARARERTRRDLCFSRKTATNDAARD